MNHRAGEQRNGVSVMIFPGESKPLPHGKRYLTSIPMQSITYKTVRSAGAAFDRAIKAGRAVAVTKRGQPYFMAVPASNPAPAPVNRAQKAREICGEFKLSIAQINTIVRRARD